MRFRHWLAALLRRCADRLDRITIPVTAGAVPGPGQSRFRVLRAMDGQNDWVLYDGPRGSEARRWWEHVKSHKERGRMEFWQDDVLRDTYVSA